MAFDTSELVLWAHGNDKKLFYYTSTADTLATINTAGYFHNTDDDVRLSADNLIYVKGSDAEALLVVSAVSSGSVTTRSASGVAHESVSSSSATLLVGGISQLAATGGATYTLPAPQPGLVKYLIRTSTSGTAINVDNATTSITYEGTNDRAVFTNAGDALTLVGLSATRWAVMTNTGSVSFS